MGKADEPKAPSALAAEAPPAQAAVAHEAREAREAREAPATREDVVFIHSPSEDGKGLRVVRKREDSLEIGELRALEEGRPVHGEVVRLKQREEHDRMFDVEVLLEGPRPRLAQSGPPQVATDAYRSNWEAIFGRPGSGSGEAPN
jgi:hypothetical protein